MKAGACAGKEVPLPMSLMAKGIRAAWERQKVKT